MGAKSKIEWTDASWNPIRAHRLSTEGDPGGMGWHCEHVSEGCRNCYAQTMNTRLGTGLEFKPGNRDQIELFLDQKMLLAPLSWRKPRMIFVCSMSDLFADFVPDEWIDRIFAVIAFCHRHTFQVLTKRPERMRGYLNDREGYLHVLDELTNLPTPLFSAEDFVWPLPNVWLGASCEDQAAFDDRWRELREVSAAVTFLSMEPLLGEIFFRPEKPDWIIIGGESGPHARSMDIAWARDILAQCRAADVPCFVKQLGARPFSLVKDDCFKHWVIGEESFENGRFYANLKSAKGGNPEEWAADLRVREFPK